MNTNQVLEYLHYICKKRKALFDCISCDELINIKICRFPICLVVNTDVSTKPGSHWVAFFKNSKNDHLEFFDSYGCCLDSYGLHFTRFAKSFNRCIENVKQIQNFNSSVCGNYTIFWLYKRLLKCTRIHVYCMFSNNFKANDDIVNNFIQSKKYLLSNIRCNKKQNQCVNNFKYK